MKDFLQLLTRRDKVNILFWVIFLSVCTSLHFAFYSLKGGQFLAISCNLIITLLFGIFMTRRTFYMDNPHLNKSCRLGRHLVDSVDDDYMEGTGKYIGEEEIKRKKRKTTYRCTREGCTYFNVNYW